MIWPRCALLLTSSLLVNEVASFATHGSPALRSHTAVSSSPNNEEETATLTETPAPEASAAKEEPVYYDILSQESPAAPMMSAGDYLPAAKDALDKTYSAYAPVNGWVPKEDYALWGLPGAIAPLGFFDPIGFARQGTPLNDAKRLRESEIMHGRVAMVASVGFLAGEATEGPFHITGPANDQLQQVPAPAFWFLTLSIAAAELYRAKKGWVEPKFKIGSNTLWTLRDNYYPGDLGFDPLGLKPTENYDFQRCKPKSFPMVGLQCLELRE
ncbi:Chlorophyll a [Seminavis robusta]|uniref:Chlorophyll a n=1 Tax=Seminavis robusta TaxID=568900 RepID=A0A9N8HIH8_9STRA|nr:LHCX6b [Seminavis robusta]CAB9515186.1 Chlorophyll a [Seminavis robusta]|eukprot:Sro698_g189300.1 Chlorophyll a (270) ;mRNA; r:41229-42038